MFLGSLPLHGGYYARSRCKNNPPRFGVSVEIAPVRLLSMGTAKAGGRSQERVYVEDELVYLSCSGRAVFCCYAERNSGRDQARCKVGQELRRKRKRV